VKPEETLAYNYLLHLGFKDVKYEPDGRVPPDFLADGRVAVEVRRLSQQVEDSSGHRSVEETSIPYASSFRKLLEKLGPPDSSERSWFVALSFRRPAPEWPRLRPRIERVLQAFKRDSDRKTYYILEVGALSLQHADWPSRALISFWRLVMAEPMLRWASESAETIATPTTANLSKRTMKGLTATLRKQRAEAAKLDATIAGSRGGMHEYDPRLAGDVSESRSSL